MAGFSRGSPTTMQISGLAIINDVRKQSQWARSYQNGDAGGAVGITFTYRKDSHNFQLAKLMSI
ncbi:hypothetical protein [Desulfosarcina sp.]|uniref:hypothetical protein n=1 Tax=Desulfosarcina sp. TaxID=2027861 RepID=UPI0035690E6B